MACSATNPVPIVGEVVAVCPYTESQLADRVICSRYCTASFRMDASDIHSSQEGERDGDDEQKNERRKEKEHCGDTKCTPHLRQQGQLR